MIGRLRKKLREPLPHAVQYEVLRLAPVTHQGWAQRASASSLAPARTLGRGHTVERKSISRTIRFEVFKRDSFTCQYCGSKAPDVVLTLDHIEPHSKGGQDDLLNLLTACDSCNGGKSDKRLSDDSAITKQRAQLEALQDRREQLDMILQWRKGLQEIQADIVAIIRDAINGRLPQGASVTVRGEESILKWLKKFGMDELLQAVDRAMDTKKTPEECFGLIPRIAYVARQELTKPYLRELYYTRGILRQRGIDAPQAWLSMQVMEKAFLSGWGIPSIQNLARDSKSWYWFNRNVSEKPEVIR